MTGLAPSAPVIEIEQLVFDGMSAEESRRATAAFSARLSELIETVGLPEDAEIFEIAEIDLGTLPVSAGSPEGLGAALAGALFSELGR